MNDQIENSILRLREESLPTCPPWLEDAVIGRIQHLGGNAWREVVGVAVRPAMAAGLLALAVTLSALTTAVASHVGGTPPADADPLGFGIIRSVPVLECLGCSCESPVRSSRGHH